MGRLFNRIREAVRGERYLVSWHADQICEERGIADWQIVAGLEEAELLRERPRSKPNPSVAVRQMLVDGTELEVVWGWLKPTGRAKLITVYFRERSR